MVGLKVPFDDGPAEVRRGYRNRPAQHGAGYRGQDPHRLGQDAEAAGFSTLGTIGRIVYPNYEELISLAAAAAVTSRIRLTTSVLLAPLYSNTALFAKQAASLDRLSGGRLVLGLGLGGRDDDYTASNLPTEGKGRRLDEQLTELKRIWSGEPRGFAGGIGPEPAGPAVPSSSSGARPRPASAGWPCSATAGLWAAARLTCSPRVRPG